MQGIIVQWTSHYEFSLKKVIAVSTEDFPHNAVIIHFAAYSPFFLLSMSYGIFHDPSTSIIFTSIDSYLGFHMLSQKEHRREIINSPNGYIANRNLINIISRNQGDIIIPHWESDREGIMRRGLMLKYKQSLPLGKMLNDTGNRPIFDNSRQEEAVWCWAKGNGMNLHGKLLEEVREILRK